MRWYLKAMRQYADFSGRARRAEYWMFTVTGALICLVPGVAIAIAIAPASETTRAAGILLMLGAAAVHFIPSMAVTVRRLHDTGRSAWWLLWSLVPYLGGVVLLVVACFDSQPGTNQYGDNPAVVTPPPSVLA